MNPRTVFVVLELKTEGEADELKDHETWEQLLRGGAPPWFGYTTDVVDAIVLVPPTKVEEIGFRTSIQQLSFRF